MKYLILLLILFLNGCHSVKYDWLPEYEPKPQNKSTQDVSKIEANIVKIKF